MEDTKLTVSYSWTQPCCNSCWAERNPDRQPIRIKTEHTNWETCVYCQSDTFSGIWIRIDPAEAKYPTQLN